MSAPLRLIVSREVHPSGPLGGMRLWMYLECGHVAKRILKARLDELTRVRCGQCEKAGPPLHFIRRDTPGFSYKCLEEGTTWSTCTSWDEKTCEACGAPVRSSYHCGMSDRYRCSDCVSIESAA